MRIITFLLVVMLGMALEYFLRLAVSPAFTLVPQLIIFLTVVDLDSSDIIPKFLTSVILYDFWVSQYLGIVTLTMLGVFVVLYFSGQIFYFVEQKVKDKQPSFEIVAPVLLSTVLFLIYFIGVHYLSILSTRLSTGFPDISWSFLSYPVIFFAIITSLTTFLVLYLGHSYIRKHVLRN